MSPTDRRTAGRSDGQHMIAILCPLPDAPSLQESFVIRSKLSLRRPLAVAGAGLIGLVATLAVATPALAAKSEPHPIITGTACVQKNGKLRIDWTVANSEKKWEATVREVYSHARGKITNIVPGATLPGNAEGVLTGRQIAPASDEPTLTVRARWTKPKRKVTAAS